MTADDTKSEESTKFNLASLFGKSSSPSSSTTTTTKTASPSKLLRKKNLEPHPSQREHISPLNLLDPSKNGQNMKSLLRGGKDGDGDMLPLHPDVKSGVLENGLSYVILPNKSPPGRFEAHLQVFSGSG